MTVSRPEAAITGRVGRASLGKSRSPGLACRERRGGLGSLAPTFRQQWMEDVSQFLESAASRVCKY